MGKSAPAAASYRSGTVVHAGGRSVVASASYRSGEVLHDERLGKTFDYTRKEDVLHAEILAPTSAPAWVQNRARLWNSVEASEKRKDARLARDIIAALPRGLDEATYTKLVREFVNDNFVAYGMVADIAIHDKDATDGERNPHMHIMLTTREVDESGFGQKNRDWNRRELIKEWRGAFEEICNRYLVEAGSTKEVSLKSYKDRGIDKTPGEHLGPDAWGLEQKSEETTKGNRNRKVANDNQVRQIAKSYQELLEPEIPAEPAFTHDDIRDLKEVGHALQEGWSEASSLRQVGHQLNEIPDADEVTSNAPHLGQISQRLTDGDDHNEREPLAAKHQSMMEQSADAMQQTRTIGSAFAAQIKHYAGLLKNQTIEMGKETISSVFNRYRNLRGISQTQRRNQEQDHDR